MALVHARLCESEKALECLKYLAGGFMAESLLTYCVDWRTQGCTDSVARRLAVLARLGGAHVGDVT